MILADELERNWADLKVGWTVDEMAVYLVLSLGMLMVALLVLLWVKKMVGMWVGMWVDQRVPQEVE